MISGFESRRFEPGGVGDRVRGGLESCDAAGPRAATSIIRLLLYAAASLPLPPELIRRGLCCHGGRAGEARSTVFESWECFQSSGHRECCWSVGSNSKNTVVVE